MKIRQGFVSNSSSSSYVIALGKIKDLELFKKEAKVEGFDYELYTTSDILNNKSWGGIKKYSNRDKVYVESFDSNTAEVKFNPDGDDTYFSIWRSDDIEEDYDGPVFEGYTEEQEELWHLEDFESIEEVDIICGYGRNG